MVPGCKDVPGSRTIDWGWAVIHTCEWPVRWDGENVGRCGVIAHFIVDASDGSPMWVCANHFDEDEGDD